MFGVYLQVADLERSLWFYRDLLALNVDWNDGAAPQARCAGQATDTVRSHRVRRAD
jgi:catechol 2,3-dioxygenase-like lactoylglutathione lyase family enzyme